MNFGNDERQPRVRRVARSAAADGHTGGGFVQQGMQAAAALSAIVKCSRAAKSRKSRVS